MHLRLGHRRMAGRAVRCVIVCACGEPPQVQERPLRGQETRVVLCRACEAVLRVVVTPELWEQVLREELSSVTMRGEVLPWRDAHRSE